MRGAHIAASLVIVGVLTGCDKGHHVSGDSNSPNTTASASVSKVANASRSSSTKQQPGSRDQPTRTLKFGATYAGGEKVSVTVSAPRPFTPSADAAKDPKFKKAVVVELTVKNGSTKPYSAMELTVTATSGGQASDAIFDSARAINSPNVYVQPGKSYRWKQAYGVNAGGDLKLKVENGVGRPVTYYTK